MIDVANLLNVLAGFIAFLLLVSVFAAVVENRERRQ